MKKIITWILIADGARARIVVNEGPNKGLYALPNGEFHHINQASHELGTDKPGRTFESAGHAHIGNINMHHAMEEVNWHEFEKHQFAAEIAKMLDKKTLENAFDRLVLVAPAKTLGDLHEKLSASAAKKVTAELVNDLTHYELHELPRYLNKVMPVSVENA